MVRKSVILVVIIVFCFPTRLFADGCPFVEEIIGADLQVKATMQRAVLWLRHGSWEIHIMPVFERYKAKAAWVVPFPVQPAVKESSADFFNQLELLTAPLFLEVCTRSNSGCGDFGTGSPGGADMQAGKGQVEVWDTGTVGELDYVIISAAEQVYIVEWLKNHNYHVTDLAEASLKKVEAEGTFFFAAKLSEDADPAKPITPVRFVLQDMKTPMYPLVLTGLGVPEGASLALSLWVISPRNNYFIPESHPHDILDQSVTDSDAYNRALTRFYLSHRSGTLALLYSQTLAESDRIRRQVCVNFSCMPFEWLETEAPAKWSTEIEEIVTNGDHLTRYEGRLVPLSLSKDLTFRALPEDGSMPILKNVFAKELCGEEEENSGCR